jgi:hypothetical protein
LRLSFVGAGEPIIKPEAVEWINAFSAGAAAGQGGLWGRYQLLGTVQAKLALIKSRIEETLSAASRLERYEDLDPSLREKWAEELTAAIEAEYRRQRAELLAGLHCWLRDVWLATLGSGAEMACLPALFGGAQAVARRVSQDAAVENLRAWEQTQRLLESNVQETLALEVGLLKLRL